MPELFLVHPGGPFWKNKDDGAWSIPKGEIDTDEGPLAAAQREFREETGQSLDGAFTPLEPVKIASGKVIEAWAIEHDLDATAITSNTFEIEWPPRSASGRPFPKWIARRGSTRRRRFRRSRRGSCHCWSSFWRG